MAGDVGIQEQVIVAAAGAADVSAAAVHVVDNASGRVSHQYGPRVLVVEESAEAAEVVSAEVADGAVSSSAADVSDDLTDDLDEVGALGFSAFKLRSSDEYAEVKVHRPLADEAWDNSEASAPDHFDDDGDDVEAFDAQAGGPTSARLTGSVAVGIIIVEGPTPALKFSAVDRTKVVAEVQNGLTWLGAQSGPGGIKFVYDIHIVTLSKKPGSSNLSSGQKEALWRDPAMKKLGYGTGMGAVNKYVQALRSSKKTNWAYCGFFTKYPVGHFAYASIGGPRLVMAYANDGWGPDNIDRVFAHETGHIFGAPDEYASSNCTCGGSWGYFKKKNGNCANCAPGGGVDCLMKSNSWAMCAWTPYHLGFPQGLRYSGVYNKGSGGYGLWVNASWPYFKAKWQQWSGQGLRLQDLEITKLGGSTRYSGVWRKGSGKYGLWVNASWPAFKAKWQQWSGQGLRLVDLEITGSGSSKRYSGVFTAGSGGYGLWVNASWASFQAKWKEWSGKGLRLDDFAIVTTGIENAASPIADSAALGDVEASSDEAGFGFSSLDDDVVGAEAGADVGFGDVVFDDEADEDMAGSDEAGFGLSSMDA